ncbi:hypothetical protein HG535_0B00990 [Zygotorulaspora mrakii]|uniref:U2 small nuclear ribonucleoprotein A' n=1 Tax=Zygotorulaspora mrakii TaxID=42260 RepID=A0A7H9AXP3_ZYGMR|nr:uncharacterized protein HG535_0B00990 [Zygotorulaspora mrakii]QLG71061.1 hypothetical protein HG535_0B00990 [Zygotorulaspora mrakii]
MKITPSVVIDAPEYYVDHFNGKYNLDKCTILRNLRLESDSEAMSSSLKHIAKPTRVLDFTNNELILIPDLQLRTDIHTILLGRNQISHVDGKALPSRLVNLVLASNNIAHFEQLNGLQASPKTLKNVVLRGNQVCHLQGYREYVVRLLPQLEVLDFTRVTPKDREKSKVESPIGAPSMSISSDNFRNEPRDKSMEIMNLVVGKMSEEKRKVLNQQLKNATSLAEIAKIEKLLSGRVQ